MEFGGNDAQTRLQTAKQTDEAAFDYIPSRHQPVSTNSPQFRAREASLRQQERQDGMQKHILFNSCHY